VKEISLMTEIMPPTQYSGPFSKCCLSRNSFLRAFYLVTAWAVCVHGSPGECGLPADHEVQAGQEHWGSRLCHSAGAPGGGAGGRVLLVMGCASRALFRRERLLEVRDLFLLRSSDRQLVVQSGLLG
jgi:hypothetical protein